MEKFSQVLLRIGLPVALIALALYFGALIFQIQHGPFAPSRDSLAGRVTASEGGTITVTDSSGVERTARITPETEIRQGRQSPDASALTVGTYAIIFGAPDESGEYTAQMIRIVTSGMIQIRR